MKTSVSPVPVDNYRPQWIATGILIAGLLSYFWINSSFSKPDSYQPGVFKPSDDKDWFLVLQMPAITTQYESGVEVMKSRYGEWLDVLVKDGFHPMRLTEINDRLEKKQGLPPKTVAFIFGAGQKRTLSFVEPIFSSRKIPATWQADEQALDRRNREYITYHTARRLKASGLWDIAYQKKNGSFRVEGKGKPDFKVKPAPNQLWSDTTGGIAFNRPTEMKSLNFLTVISDWTPEDLLTRIRAELPIEEKTYLSIARIQNLTWGITKNLESEGPHSFNLKVLPERSSILLAWHGSAGIQDQDIIASCGQFVGQVALRLRWDDRTGEGIQVSFSRNALNVSESAGGKLYPVLHLDRPHNQGFNARVQLNGNYLSVYYRDSQEIYSAPVKTQGTPTSLFHLYLSNRVRDTAEVERMRLIFTPL